MKEVSELYRQMLDVFTEKTGFSMDDSADLAVRLYAAAAHLSFDNRMPPEEAAKALQKLLTE